MSARARSSVGDSLELAPIDLSVKRSLVGPLLLALSRLSRVPAELSVALEPTCRQSINPGADAHMINTYRNISRHLTTGLLMHSFASESHYAA